MEMTFRIGTLPLKTRMVLFALLETAGIALQLVLLGSGFPFFPSLFAGLIPMAGGVLPLRAKGYTNKPADLGFEEWQPAREEEVRRIASNFSLTRKVRIPLYFRGGFGIIAGALLLFFAFFSGAAGNAVLALIAVDAAVLFYPVLFSARVRLFVPRGLEMKLSSFMPVIDARRPASIVLTPYLRLDRDAEGRRIPEDIRLMYEPKRKPADFNGVQIQVAINKGPNGNVPYMYAVFITRGTGKTYRQLSGMDFGRFVVERQTEGEYGTIVVRQETSGTGYHTRDGDCRELYDELISALEKLPAAG